jgi:spore germination cell wall hydrolase CwlJ-like protein
MAARWIGLARPSKRDASRFHQHHNASRPLMGVLRALGIAGALTAAAAFNVAAAPDALTPAAQAASIEVSPLTLLAIPDPREVHLLAATMWGEARSEGENGMRAVAHVMVNRVGPRFGEDLRSVILAPKQFSAWNMGDPNRPLVQNPERYAKSKEDRITWQAAQRIAYEVLSGVSADPTGGALFYHTRAVSPSWSRYGVDAHVIGAHIFYEDVPDQRPRQRYAAAAGAETAENAPVVRRGPRAGRVNGVIQYAPAPELRGRET